MKQMGMTAWFNIVIRTMRKTSTIRRFNLEFRFYLEQERSFNIYKKKITHCARAMNVPQLI